MESPKLSLKGTARQTPQREHILSIIEKAKGPLSATEIYELARQTRPDLGLATIYRTLKILLELGAVRVVNLPDGLTRYENAGLGRHHFQCQNCQRIWTIKNGALGVLKGSRLEGGFVINDHDSTFYGLCPKCRASPED